MESSKKRINSSSIHHKYANATKTSNTPQPLGEDNQALIEILKYAYMGEQDSEKRTKKYRKWWHRLKRKHSHADVQTYSILEFLPNSLSQDFRSDRVPSRKLRDIILFFLECYNMCFLEPKEGLTAFLSYILSHSQEPLVNGLNVQELFKEYYGHYFLLSLFLHPTVEYEARVNYELCKRIVETVERIKKPHRISNRLGYREYNYLCIRIKQIYTNAHHKPL